MTTVNIRDLQGTLKQLSKISEQVFKNTEMMQWNLNGAQKVCEGENFVIFFLSKVKNFAAVF